MGKEGYICSYLHIEDRNMEILRNFQKYEKRTNPLPNLAPKIGAIAYVCEKLDSILLMRNLGRHQYHDIDQICDDLRANL